MNRDIENMRLSYEKGTLDKDTTPINPFLLFEEWFEQAKKSKIVEPNALTLATSTLDGKPSARIVLLKGFSDKGFIFYTNYQSRKAEEMARNPQVAVVILWKEMERQIRIEGVVKKVSEAESSSYFHSRPIKSQMGAVASNQSKEIKSRKVLESQLKDIEEKYASAEHIPKPIHWGGYILIPNAIEFWQGRRNRLHDRIKYLTTDGSSWSKVRLQP